MGVRRPRGHNDAILVGSSVTTAQANFSGDRKGTVPVGTFEANPWGLFNVHGNAWEWCEDGWHGDYNGAPNDGSACPPWDPRFRVLRGGSWIYPPQLLRSAVRREGLVRNRDNNIGFRVARTLNL
jgi:formylglycine-generating enzyme required for sulfatase activity